MSVISSISTIFFFLHGQLVDHVIGTHLFQVSTVTIQLVRHFLAGGWKVQPVCFLSLSYLNLICFGFKQNVIGKRCEEFEYDLQDVSWKLLQLLYHYTCILHRSLVEINGIIVYYIFYKVCIICMHASHTRQISWTLRKGMIYTLQKLMLRYVKSIFYIMA